MKTRKTGIAVLLALVVLLLIGSVAPARSNGPQSAQYVVAPGAASGGSYRLTVQAWQVSGVASSERYHLLSPASPAGTGTPCCCAYLPCVLK
jgi:hypothetical protein